MNLKDNSHGQLLSAQGGPRGVCWLLKIFFMMTFTLLDVTCWQSGRPSFSLIRHDKTLPLPEEYSYDTLFFDQTIDHFGFASSGRTFKQKYLYVDQFWNKKGPIFFYTGNEGAIEWFCNNTGFMWDIAPQFNALLVFAEHRYYGDSLPFGQDSYQNATTLDFLTSEQALADFATLIRYLKQTVPGAADKSVVAFGGSYGGMLATWFRIKYPNVVIGSLAASAPIWEFTGLIPCNAFYDSVSNTWYKTSKTCGDNVRRSYKIIEEIAAKVGGYEYLSKTFKLCKPLTSKYDLDPFMSMLLSTYTNLAMVDYPYPASFMADLPGWPVQVACSYLSKPMDGPELLNGLAQVVNLYYNYTGNTKCILTDDSTSPLGYEGWNYQACTEMVFPMCSNGSGVAYSFDWDFQKVSDDCYRQYKVRPRENWISLEYWAKALKDASNIIFSNGLLDPWASGGVLQTVSESVIAIQIPRAAHHLDLRAKNPQDTREVTGARDQEVNIIKGWLQLTPED